MNNNILKDGKNERKSYTAGIIVFIITVFLAGFIAGRFFTEQKETIREIQTVQDIGLTETQIESCRAYFDNWNAQGERLIQEIDISQ